MKGLPRYHGPFSQQREAAFQEQGECRESWPGRGCHSLPRIIKELHRLVKGVIQQNRRRGDAEAPSQHSWTGRNSHPVEATGSKAQVSCSLGDRGQILEVQLL